MSNEVPWRILFDEWFAANNEVAEITTQTFSLFLKSYGDIVSPLTIEVAVTRRCLPLEFPIFPTRSPVGSRRLVFTQADMLALYPQGIPDLTRLVEQKRLLPISVVDFVNLDAPGPVRVGMHVIGQHLDPRKGAVSATCVAFSDLQSYCRYEEPAAVS